MLEPTAAVAVAPAMVMRTAPQHIPVRPDGLQIDCDAGFERRHWWIERVAWLGFAALIGAALAGLTGDGGALDRTSAQVGPHSVAFPAIARLHAPARFDLQMDAAERMHEIVLPPELTAAFPVIGVTPAPAAQFSTARGLHLMVEAQQGKVVIEMRPRRAGTMDASLQIDEHAVPLSILVLP